MGSSGVMAERPIPAQPFSGVRVLSFAQLAVGPAAVQLLADFGADVIKIERPGSGAWERSWAGAGAKRGGESFFFLALNRNQRSITVNLKDERGREIILNLIRKSDVLVENFRPGVMKRLGLDYESVREINPRLVYASATGFGSDPAYQHWPGQDLIVQGVSGLAAMTGREDYPPTPAGSAVVDFHASALLALAIAFALLQRERTGYGQRVETSLLDAALHLQSEPMFYFLNGWDVTRRSEAGLGTPFHEAPYGIYPTKDAYMSLAHNPLHVLAEALELPALNEFSESDLLARRDEIKRLIETITPSRTTAEWLERLRSYDIWCGPVYTYPQLFDDPDLRLRQRVTQLHHPTAGELVYMPPPIRLSEESRSPMTRPPRLGEHTDEILQQLGYTEDEIRRLRKDGVI